MNGVCWLDALNGQLDYSNCNKLVERFGMENGPIELVGRGGTRKFIKR